MLTCRAFADTDDLTAQASALALRDNSTAVAKVLGSAAGASDNHECCSAPTLIHSRGSRRILVGAIVQGIGAALRDGCTCRCRGGPERYRQGVRR